ncbi:transcription factor ORG2-like [Humulus lupulus]|uniref:transcription factor ORG2-like n=1 Tax=Humulus lupulus TaxID=3486 RepID=UPI002B4105C2|nr:transcription factor ORG2-like [Humulus lupulus]
MLALTPTPPPPPFISTNIVGWPLEDPIRHEDQNYFFRDIATSSDPDQYSLLFLNNYFPAPPPPSDQDHHHHRFEVDLSTTPSSSTTITINTTTDLTMVKKKLNHNASERDRRKKVNHMYSALRALLPISDHTKKLSIPATVSRVLKYVPELQEEIEGLVHMKKELLSRIKSRQQGNTTTDQEINKIKSTAPNSLSSISATQLSDKEVAVQISTYKLHNNLLSQMLHNLENDGLSLLHASSFESFGGRLFHNLHLQVEGSYCMESGTTLDKKLLSFHDNKEKLLIM